ncbi:AraC family transcriptional regulator [bacterium]|nr:AraC family transcriptional regulator [bacterium]
MIVQRPTMKAAASHFGHVNQEAISRKMTLAMISRIKQLMRESCGRAGSIEHLCANVEIPYHTLRKLFRRFEGISLVDYWQRCRLQKAEELLSHQNKYIFEVAYEMGFSSDGNFTNWFKKQKGVTPKEFRQHLQRG